MSTPFLLEFASDMVYALIGAQLLEVTPGRERATVEFVAAWLARKSKGGLLITSTADALVSCPDVVELYADNDQMKTLMESLRYPQ
ncbi:MAG: hypothetical protein ACI9MC_001768 [Kiritimatiellia bacterium]|jgi:hypothetical protein